MSDAAALTLSRLIALTEYLAANSGVTVAEAARHFGRTTRQIRKDVELLLDAGFGDLLPGNTLELDAFAYEESGVLVLRTPLGLDQTSTITGQELALMLYGLHAIAPVLSSEESKAVPTATEKLYGLAGITADQQVQPPLSTVSLLESADHIAVIREAIDSSTAMDIDYVRGDGQRSRRTVFPLGLTFERDGWMLSAICDQVGERRSFRLDRMVTTTPNARRRQKAVHTAESERPDRTVTVRLNPDAAWVTHEIAATEVRASDGELEADFAVWDKNWVRTELILLSEYVEATDPPEAKLEAGKFAQEALLTWNAVLGAGDE